MMADETNETPTGGPRGDLAEDIGDLMAAVQMQCNRAGEDLPLAQGQLRDAQRQIRDLQAHNTHLDLLLRIARAQHIRTLAACQGKLARAMVGDVQEVEQWLGRM